MSRLLISTYAVLVFAYHPPGSLARAQQSAPSAEEERFVQTEEGFSIGLAGGFQLAKRHDGYFLLGSSTVPGLILVKPMPGLSEAELRRGVETGYHDKSVDLTPAGNPSKIVVQGAEGRIVEVTGSLFKMNVRGLLAGYLRPEGGGLLLFAVTAPEQWPVLEPVADEMAHSLNLFEPDPAEIITIWTERLSGSQLTRAPADAAEKETGQETYSVCRDGTFFYDDTSSKPETSSPGSWKLTSERRQVKLIFKFQDGRERSYRLDREELETYLDGKRYFVTPAKRCN